MLPCSTFLPLQHLDRKEAQQERAIGDRSEARGPEARQVGRYCKASFENCTGERKSVSVLSRFSLAKKVRGVALFIYIIIYIII